VIQGVLDILPQGFTSAASVDIVWTIDCSSSMDGVIGMIRQAMQNLHSQMGPNDRIGIVAYSKSGWEVLPLTTKRDYPNKAGVIAQKLHTQSVTYAARGLKLAVNMLANSLAATKVIVLITDGAETDEEKGEQAAADELRDKGIHIVPVTISSAVQQRFFNTLMQCNPDPAAPILPAQATFTSQEIEKLPGTLYGVLRSRIGTDVKVQIEMAGMTQISAVYEVSPNLRAVTLQPDGSGGIVVEPNDDLVASGMGLYIQASYEAPEEDALDPATSSSAQPFINRIVVSWNDISSGQAQSCELGALEVNFVLQGAHDMSPDPALKDIFRLVMAQQKIDEALRLAQTGKIDQSIAALDQAGSIAAAAGSHTDLADLVASMKKQVASGSLSAQTVGASIARASIAAQDALKQLQK